MFISIFWRALAVMALVLMSACASEPSSKTYVCRNLSKEQYCVQAGDSLMRIAQRFQVDTNQLRIWNALASDVIHPGQALVISHASVQPPQNTHATTSSNGFILQWPIHGNILVPYGQSNNKGIDIAAPRGTLVQAAADGVVMYVGSGVSGYGNLLLIRHSDSVVTAYAYNESLLVADKAQVKAGQIVAAVGDSGRNDGKTALHFEVRVNGKPVNPNLYLK